MDEKKDNNKKEEKLETVEEYQCKYFFKQFFIFTYDKLFKTECLFKRLSRLLVRTDFSQMT